MNWRWLDRRIIAAVHLRQLQRHGGGHGTRDEGLLDSALARPQNLAAYGQPTVFELAASYAFGLARNHPFVDGNKRTAFVAAALFLRRNGQVLEADQAEAALIFIRLAAGDLSEAELAEWLRRNSAPPDADFLVAEQDQ
jgi:death on curing protein